MMDRQHGLWLGVLPHHPAPLPLPTQTPAAPSHVHAVKHLQIQLWRHTDDKTMLCPQGACSARGERETLSHRNTVRVLLECTGARRVRRARSVAESSTLGALVPWRGFASPLCPPASDAVSPQDFSPKLSTSTQASCPHDLSFLEIPFVHTFEWFPIQAVH